MSKQRLQRKGPSRRDPDLSQNLQEPVEPAAIFREPQIECAEHAIRVLNLGALIINSFRLESCSFEKVNMSGSVIRSGKWKDVRMAECDFANVQIQGFSGLRIAFVGCRMTGIRCPETEWQDLLISAGDQRYAQFRFASFRSAEFDNCNLEDADFYGADLKGCVFRHCNLRNVDMSKTKLESADFRGSVIDGMRVNADDVRGAIVDAAQALTLAPLLGIRIS